jgi:preprotein translocase subunit YajC
MMAAPLSVLLQAEGAPAGPDMSFFMMMALIFLIFYVLVMRPQQRQQKERDEMIKAAGKGDKVVTAGGIHGTVMKASDETLTVEIARVKGGARVEVEVSRGRIESVVKAGAQSEGSESS